MLLAALLPVLVPEFGAACIMADITAATTVSPERSCTAWSYVSFGAFILLVLTAAMLVARSIARPLARLSVAVCEYDEGKDSAPVPAQGSDELAALASNWNSMTARFKELKAQLNAEHYARVQESTYASRRLMAIQEEERRRLSAELHDQTSPNLAALVINLKRIEKAMSALASPSVRALLNDTSQLLRETMVSVRQISANLRPTTLDYGGLWPTLESYALQFSQRTGIAVHCQNLGALQRLPADAETSLFRIVQEALTNAAKHSGAANIELVLASSDDGVELKISDDGVGFDKQTLERPGHGLVTMRERALFAGCSWSLESAPGRGTRLNLLYPHRSPSAVTASA